MSSLEKRPSIHGHVPLKHTGKLATPRFFPDMAYQVVQNSTTKCFTTFLLYETNTPRARMAKAILAGRPSDCQGRGRCRSFDCRKAISEGSRIDCQRVKAAVVVAALKSRIDLVAEPDLRESD